MKKNLLRFAAMTAIGIAFSNASNAQNWLTTGNAGTDTATKFVGTTDNVGLKIKTNNTDRIFVTTNGRVGINTNAPAFNLEVANNNAVTMGIRSVTAGATVSMDRGLATANAAFAYKSLGTTLWNTGILGNDNYTIRNAAGGNNVVIITPANNVGIGTGAPTQKLDVNGNINTTGSLTATGTLTATGGNSTNWNTAFSWGNHALAGYLTAEVDPEVGVNTTNYASKWDGTSLVTSNIFSSGTFAGVNSTAAIGSSQFVVGSTSSFYYGMYVNSTGTAGNRKPFYGYALGGASNCWTYFDEINSTWKVYNNGDRFTVDNQGQIGIGTNTPGYYLDIQAASGYRALNASSSYVGSVGQIVNFERTSAPSSANDILQITVPAGSPSDFQYIEADKGGSNRFQVNGDGSVGIGFSTLSTARLNVDGSNVENKKLYGIYATVDSSTTSSVAIYGVHELVGSNVDAKGIYGKCIANPGYGYGVYGEAGYIGVRGLSTATTYTGTAYGVYGSASGSSAGTRIGVYGFASGGVTNWAGYFPGNTYSSQLMVGTTTGATGYIANIGGKLIAEEVRVALQANWPDYVFNSDYKMLSLDELESYVTEFNHLPGVPSACEVEQNGLHLGQMQNVIMEKTEENTLYILQLKKEINELKAIINELKNK